MPLPFKIIFCSMVLLLSWPCQSQVEIPLGSMQNPPGMTWQKIITPHFRIIFPGEIQADAQHVANTLEHIYLPDAKTLRRNARVWPLVMHNQNTESNGFVTLAPRRSEWFNTPPQTGLIGVNPWYHVLAVHEFRHMVQIDAARTGLTKWLYYILGDAGHLAGAFFSLPAWVWEGDATVNETLLTRSGRGRMPEFTMPIRTLLLNDQRYSYYKMMFGSYRNWSANPYEFGYLMISHVRRQYGADMWPAVIRRTQLFSLLPYNFTWSMRRKTGHSSQATYQQAMDALQRDWRWQAENTTTTNHQRLSRPGRFTTHYLYPQSWSDSSVVVLKYGFGDRLSLSEIKYDGHERVLHLPGNIFTDPISVTHEKIFWYEKQPDPRWGYRDHTVIKCYDRMTRQVRRIGRPGKWAAPSPAPDGRRIAVVEYTPANQCRLVILDANTGAELKQLENPDNAFLMTPRWSEDGQRIVLNRLTAQGRSLSIYEVESGSITDLVPCGNENTAVPVFYGDYVLFNWDYSGIDNIYAIHCRTREIKQVTSARFGAFNPAPSSDGRFLYYNDYQIKGYSVARMKLDSTTWRPLSSIPRHPPAIHEPLLSQEAGIGLLDSIPQKQYQVEPYNALGNPFHIHSWSILEDEHRNDTYSVYMQNLLGSASGTFSYIRNSNQKTNRVAALLSYAGWYPILDLAASAGGRTSGYTDMQNKDVLYHWNEKTASLGLRLPLDLSRNVYSTHVELGVQGAWTDVSNLPVRRNFDNNNGRFLYTTWSLYGFRGYQWTNEPFPHRGQSLSIIQRQTPSGSDYSGSLFAARAITYWPGAAPRHGIRIMAGYEKQSAENYRFDNELAFSRGYSYQFHDRFSTVSADYALPLCYPDWNVLGLLYLKRLQWDGFYDITRTAGKGSFASVGSELTVNYHLFSMPFELITGVRNVYRLQDKIWRAEVLLGAGL